MAALALTPARSASMLASSSKRLTGRHLSTTLHRSLSQRPVPTFTPRQSSSGASTSRQNFRAPQRQRTNPDPSLRPYALVDRPDVTAGHERPSQRPFGVAQKVQGLIEEGKLDEAIRMVTSAPISSQNSVVWALLIKQALHENKANLAFSLFNDMKRRDFQPTARTYGTIFSGYNKLSDMSEKQWERVETIWEQYQSFLASARTRPITSESDNLLASYVPYLEMLGKRRDFDTMMTVFEAMDKEGPLAPDKFVYTTLLLQILRRKEIVKDRRRLTSMEEILLQNASDTLTIAERMHESGIVDSFALTAILRGLVKGKDAHRERAYELVTSYIGDLSNAETLRHPQMYVEHRLLDVILELCCSMGKYELVLDMFEGIKTSSKLRKVLTRSHVDYVLDAFAYLASKPEATTYLSQRTLRILEYTIREGYGGHTMSILPNRGTYNRVFVTAWKCKDWPTALRLTEIMTGLDTKRFENPTSDPLPSGGITRRKSSETIVDLDAQSMSYLVRTAQDVKEKKVALRIFEHYGGVRTLFRKRAEGDAAFYRYKLASAVQEAIISLMGEPLTQAERAGYKSLLDEVKEEKDRLKGSR